MLKPGINYLSSIVGILYIQAITHKNNKTNLKFDQKQLNLLCFGEVESREKGFYILALNYINFLVELKIHKLFKIFF